MSKQTPSAFERRMARKFELAMDDELSEMRLGLESKIEYETGILEAWKREGWPDWALANQERRIEALLKELAAVEAEEERRNRGEYPPTLRRLRRGGAANHD